MYHMANGIVNTVRHAVRPPFIMLPAGVDRFPFDANYNTPKLPPPTTVLCKMRG